MSCLVGGNLSGSSGEFVHLLPKAFDGRVICLSSAQLEWPGCGRGHSVAGGVRRQQAGAPGALSSWGAEQCSAWDL